MITCRLTYLQTCAKTSRYSEKKTHPYQISTGTHTYSYGTLKIHITHSGCYKDLVTHLLLFWWCFLGLLILEAETHIPYLNGSYRTGSKTVGWYCVYFASRQDQPKVNTKETQYRQWKGRIKKKRGKKKTCFTKNNFDIKRNKILNIPLKIQSLCIRRSNRSWVFHRQSSWLDGRELKGELSSC